MFAVLLSIGRRVPCCKLGNYAISTGYIPPLALSASSLPTSCGGLGSGISTILEEVNRVDVSGNTSLQVFWTILLDVIPPILILSRLKFGFVGHDVTPEIRPGPATIAVEVSFTSRTSKYTTQWSQDYATFFEVWANSWSRLPLGARVDVRFSQIGMLP